MDKLRLGIIGTGSVVREIYEYLYYHSDYSPLIRVEAICSRHVEHMKGFGDDASYSGKPEIYRL